MRPIQNTYSKVNSHIKSLSYIQSKINFEMIDPRAGLAVGDQRECNEEVRALLQPMERL